MDQRPLISVVIPTYNCAEFLPAALESVMGQTYNRHETIVVDDGSADNTQEVIRPYLSRGNVRYVFQGNQGLPGARNTGVRLAKGEYIAALDADDLLAPDALEKMLHATRSANVSWCLVDLLRFWDDYSEEQRTHFPEESLLLGILRTHFVLRAMFFRRDTLLSVGMWDPLMKNLEDWDLNIRMIERREPFAYVSEPLYHYRKRPGSITTVAPVKIIDYWEMILKKHHKRLCLTGMEEVRPLYAAAMWHVARRQFYEKRQILRAMISAYESMKFDLALPRIVHALRYMVGIRLLGGSPKTL